jgi:serine/threonine protein kinase
MRRLEHPNIVQYYDSREVSSTQYNIYMEFCEGKNLEDYVTQNKKFESTYRLAL